MRSLIVAFNAFLVVVLTLTPRPIQTTLPPVPAGRLFLPLVQNAAPPPPSPPVISALHYDGYLTDEPDEAFQLYNPLDVPVSLSGWRVSDGTRRAVFPDGIMLGPGARLWCAARCGGLSDGLRPSRGLRVCDR